MLLVCILNEAVLSTRAHKHFGHFCQRHGFSFYSLVYFPSIAAASEVLTSNTLGWEGRGSLWCPFDSTVFVWPWLRSFIVTTGGSRSTCSRVTLCHKFKFSRPISQLASQLHMHAMVTGTVSDHVQTQMTSSLSGYILYSIVIWLVHVCLIRGLSQRAFTILNSSISERPWTLGIPTAILCLHMYNIHYCHVTTYYRHVTTYTYIII